MTKETKDFAQGESAAIVRDISAQGDWVPLIDWSSTFPGNRGVNRAGRYKLYDAPVGVRITIEEARKAGPILAADQEWDGLGSDGAALCVARCGTIPSAL